MVTRLLPGCTGKRRHETEALARCAMEELRNYPKRIRKRGPLVAYRCRFCGCWHVGHKRKRGGHA